MDLFTYHKFNTNVLKILKKLLKLVKKLKLKFLKLTQMQSAYHFLSKLLKSVQLKKKDKKKKNVLLVHVVQNVKKNVISNFQKHKQDSQWLTCSVISNFNQIENSQNPLFPKQGIFLLSVSLF